MNHAVAGTRAPVATKQPRLGFLGVGWIGRHRMQAVLESGFGEVAAIADPVRETAAEAGKIATEAEVVDDLEALLGLGLDGIVIATPSALHAAQAISALEHGVAVFCQKPLGRTASEVESVLEAARRNDRLLGLDLCYRHTDAMVAIKKRIDEGAIGRIFAADLTFHNAYGPDKPWFYDPRLSGGGCAIDLGIHLVDLALWVSGFPEVRDLSAHLHADGIALDPSAGVVEDHAVAAFETETGTVVRLACSWKLHAGEDAQISAVFHGTGGGLRFGNVDGSFYDFVAEAFHGTRREIIAKPPDPWGGRAIVEWARRLARGDGYASDADRFLDSATVIDAIYRR